MLGDVAQGALPLWEEPHGGQAVVQGVGGRHLLAEAWARLGVGGPWTPLMECPVLERKGLSSPRCTPAVLVTPRASSDRGAISGPRIPTALPS